MIKMTIPAESARIIGWSFPHGLRVPSLSRDGDEDREIDLPVFFFVPRRDDCFAISIQRKGKNHSGQVSPNSLLRTLKKQRHPYLLRGNHQCLGHQREQISCLEIAWLKLAEKKNAIDSKERLAGCGGKAHVLGPQQ